MLIFPRRAFAGHDVMLALHDKFGSFYPCYFRCGSYGQVCCRECYGQCQPNCSLVAIDVAAMGLKETYTIDIHVRYMYMYMYDSVVIVCVAAIHVSRRFDIRAADDSIECVQQLQGLRHHTAHHHVRLGAYTHPY